MKANTAATCQVNGQRKEMVGVYKHAGKKNEIDPYPPRLKKPPGNKCRKNEMQKIVNNENETHERLLVALAIILPL